MIVFYLSVFGVEFYFLFYMFDGCVMYGEFWFDGLCFYFSEEFFEYGGIFSFMWLGGISVVMYLYVDNCDELIEMMKSVGVMILMEFLDMFWGECFGCVCDFFGYEWGIVIKIWEMILDEICIVVEKMFNDMVNWGKDWDFLGEVDVLWLGFSNCFVL